MSANRTSVEIRTAALDHNWDEVIKLAEQAKANEQAQLITETIRNPKQAEIKLVGRNGQEVTYVYPISQGQVAELTLDHVVEREEDEDDPFSSRCRPLQVSPRRLHFSLDVRTR